MPTRRGTLVIVAGAVLLAAGAGLIVILSSGGARRPVPEPPSEEPPARPRPPARAAEDGVAAADRARIVETLGEDPEPVQRLVAALLAPPGPLPERLRECRAALDTAVRAHEPASGTAVVRLLAACIADHRAEEVAEGVLAPVLAAALGAPAPEVRVAAVRLLPLLRRPADRQRAVEALADEDYRVRAAAVAAYGALSDSGGARRLRDLYFADPEPPVRLAVLAAFETQRRLRGAHAFEVAGHALQGGTPAERSAALRDYALHRDYDGLAGLRACLASPVAAVRLDALNTVLLLRDRRVVAEVERLSAEDESESVRDLAARVLPALR